MKFLKKYFTLIVLLFLSLCALGPFIISLFPDYNYYPVAFHRNFMLGVLVNFIIVSLLHTGLSKFKESKKLTKVERFTPYVLLFISAVFYSKQIPFYIAQTLFYSLLIVSILRRFWIDKKEHQFVFYFILSSLFYGLVSSVLMINNSNTYFLLSKKITYFGLHLGFFVGVALYFIPHVFHDERLINRFKNFFKRKKYLYNELQVLLLLFHIQVIGEFFHVYNIVLATRFLFLFLPALTYFKLWRLPFKRNWISIYLWLSLWSLMIGMMMAHSNSTDFMHWIHLFFINTYLLAAMICFNSFKIGLVKLIGKQVKILFGLLLFAGLTRATAYLMPQTYVNHLAYAGLLIVLVMVWNLYLISRRTQ